MGMGLGVFLWGSDDFEFHEGDFEIGFMLFSEEEVCLLGRILLRALLRSARFYY